MTPEDARAKIVKLIEGDPRITVAELTRKTKVSRQRVYQILEAMGYNLDCVWTRKAVGK